MSSHTSVVSGEPSSWLTSLCPCLQPLFLYRRVTSVDDHTTSDDIVTLRVMDRTPQLFHINTEDLIPPQVRTLIELYASANNVLRKRSAAEKTDNDSTTYGDNNTNTSNNNDINSINTNGLDTTDTDTLITDATSQFDSNDITNEADENTSFLPGTLIHFMKHNNASNQHKKDASRATSRRPTTNQSHLDTHQTNDKVHGSHTDADNEHITLPPTTLTIDVGSSDNRDQSKNTDLLEEKTNDDTLQVPAPQRSPLFILIHKFFQPTPITLDASPTTSFSSPTCSPLLCPSPSDFM